MSANQGFGHNSRGYRWGNRYEVGAWGELHPGPVGIRGGLENTWQNAIHGVDSELDAQAVPTADGSTRQGYWLNIVPALSFTYLPYGSAFTMLQLGVDGRIPLYQDLGGPQLAADYQVGAFISGSVKTAKR